MGASGSKDPKKLSNSTNEKLLFSESKKSSSAKQDNPSSDLPPPPPSSSSFSSSSSASDLLFGKQKEFSRSKREQEEPAPQSSEGKRRRVEELPIQPESQLFSSSAPHSSLPVVVDRCKKSKKRRDPQLSASQSVLPFESSSSLAAKSSAKTASNSPVKTGDIEEETLFQDKSTNPSSSRKLSALSPPSSSLKSKSQKPVASSPPSSGADSSFDSSKKQDSLLSASSSDFSQHSTISQASILRQLDALPRAAVQSTGYWLTPFLQSEFAGESNAHSENVEHELTRILSKVFVVAVC